MRILGTVCAMAFSATSFAAQAFQFNDDFWGSFPPIRLSPSIVFGDCGDPCIVRDNDGGVISFFLGAASTLRAESRLLVIDGYCASACALAADTLRPNVCITANASFYFHLGTFTQPTVPMAEIPPVASEQWYAMIDSGELTVERFPIKHSSDILDWVNEQGGYPEGYTFDTMLKMSTKQASQFWPTCGPEVQVLPRLRPEWPPTPHHRPPRT